MSSSRCARVMPTSTGPCEVSTTSRPWAASGSSYWIMTLVGVMYWMLFWTPRFSWQSLRIGPTYSLPVRMVSAPSVTAGKMPTNWDRSVESHR